MHIESKLSRDEAGNQPDPPALLLLQVFADRMAATSRSCCWKRDTLCMVRDACDRGRDVATCGQPRYEGPLQREGPCQE